MNWKDINSIPKEINDYINYRKKIKNTENLFIRSDFIFSREDFITDDYFLCEIILLLTALSKNAEIYMIKISDMSTEIQEFWSDVLSKYIEVRSIREDDESIFLQTPMGMFNHISKDKNSNKKIFEVSSTINRSNNTNFFDIEEKKNLMKIIDKNKKDIKEQQKIITSLNLQNQEIKKNKDNKILGLEKKIKEYEDEIKNLNQIIKDYENKSIKEKKLEEENKNLKEKLLKSVNENLVLKTYKEYKSKYESLINQNQNLENITETKEKYLISLKNNVNIQKENERLRKEISSLKEELKKQQKENNKNINNENGKEINYKEEYENLNIKAERYKYLLDNKDKQIENLKLELEKKQNKKIDENGGINLEKDLIKSSEINNNINNTGASSKIQSKKFRNKNLNINNYEPKINSVNKNFSTKNSNSTNLSGNKNSTREEKINKTKNNSKSEKKKNKAINNKKLLENNNNDRISHNIFPSNNLNIDLLNNDILSNPILNLNSSVKIETGNNLEYLLKQLKDEDNNINKKKEQNFTKNNSVNMNIKPLLNNIYNKLKKDKKNHNEFFAFLKKVDKELNLDISHHFHQNNSNTNNNNILNEEVFNEQIKELKKELTQYKMKESETKVKITFLQSEKIKLESELKKISQNTPYKLSHKNSMIKKYYSSTKKLNNFPNLNINSELSKLTMDFINNSPNKEKEEESADKDKKFFNEKNIKYSFKRKKLLNNNKSTSIDNDTGANNEKNSSSIYEDESNENGKGNEINNIKGNNDEIFKELNDKINDLVNDKNTLENNIKNLNENLENIKIKDINLENINSSLIKENIELKQSLILIKENYENEFNLVSSSLINLTEKYQKLTQELKEKSDE